MDIKKLKILATEYKVEEVEQIDKYQRLLGQIEYTEQTIKIDKNISEDMKKETLIHEILHGILEKLGYEDLKRGRTKGTQYCSYHVPSVKRKSAYFFLGAL